MTCYKKPCVNNRLQQIGSGKKFQLDNLRNSDDDWVNNAQCLRLRGQINRKAWKEVVDKDLSELEFWY